MLHRYGPTAEPVALHKGTTMAHPWRGRVSCCKGAEYMLWYTRSAARGEQPIPLEPKALGRLLDANSPHGILSFLRSTAGACESTLRFFGARSPSEQRTQMQVESEDHIDPPVEQSLRSRPS